VQHQNSSTYADSGLENQLIEARKSGLLFIEQIRSRQLIQAGFQTELVQRAIYELAAQILYPPGQKPRFWHRQILRAGADTIYPYCVKTRNNLIQPGDIVFVDLGPVLSIGTEVDLGRSLIVPEPNIDPEKLRICDDCERLFVKGKTYYLQNQHMTGRQLYEHMQYLAEEYGWKLSSQRHSGHLIGIFPHEQILGDTEFDYICPENTKPMSALDRFGHQRYWILEVHLIHPQNLFGAFYEDLLIDTPHA
jgi:hypothetical protein